MQEERNIILRKLEISDIYEMEFPVAPENVRFTKEYIKQYYFHNTISPSSFWVASKENKVKGYLTANTYRFLIEGKNLNVSVPINGYIDTDTRRKGLFVKLFQEIERECLNDLKIDFFIAFANKKSVGILINKLNYMPAKCPDLLISLFNPFFLFKKASYKILKNIDCINFTGAYSFENSFKKDKEYYHWRYKNYTEKQLRILEIKDIDKIIGYAIILLVKRKGIRFMILSDIVCYKAADSNVVFKEATHYATRSFFPFLITYKLQEMKIKNTFCFILKNRFNFLVKGKSERETIYLSKKTYNLFLGDMDFI